MTRTIKKRVISIIMAVAMVCTMMICATTAFAAEISNPENTDIETMTSTRATVYSSSQWNFKQQKDTNSFGVSAGQSVSFNMGSLSSTSGQGFNVKLCRMVNGVPQVTSGPIHVDANRSYGSTVTFNVDKTGTYIIRCERTNDSNAQIINNVSVYVG